jgi:hypothetical protein
VRGVADDEVLDEARAPEGRLDGDDPAPVVAEEGRALLALALEQCRDVADERAEVVGVDPGRGSRQVVPPEVRHEDAEPPGQRVDVPAPGPPALREPVERDQRRVGRVAGRDVVDVDAVEGRDAVGPATVVGPAVPAHRSLFTPIGFMNLGAHVADVRRRWGGPKTAASGLVIADAVPLVGVVAFGWDLTRCWSCTGSRAPSSVSRPSRRHAAARARRTQWSCPRSA